jgi:hypothetical protein
MSKIFISYRRDDAPGSAALLYEHLARAFGASNVFMDVDDVLAGKRFDQQLQSTLAACDIFLAVIGRRWLDLLKAKRAARQRDYVSDEIAAALARRVVVVPVLVERGTLSRRFWQTACPCPLRGARPDATANFVLPCRQEFTMSWTMSGSKGKTTSSSVSKSA